MKIKIKCKDEERGVWYNSHVGEVFDVVRVEECGIPKIYVVMYDHPCGRTMEAYVPFFHAEVLPNI